MLIGNFKDFTELTKGRSLTIRSNQACRRGNSYAITYLSIRKGEDKPHKVRAQDVRAVVTDRQAHEDGGWLYTITLDTSHKPRLLHRDSSKAYTDRPEMALRGESEAVDDVTLKRYAADAEVRHSEFQQARQRLVPLAVRLQRALDVLEGQGVDVSRQRRRVEQATAELERKANQRRAA